MPDAWCVAAAEDECSPSGVPQAQVYAFKVAPAFMLFAGYMAQTTLAAGNIVTAVALVCVSLALARCLYRKLMACAMPDMDGCVRYWHVELGCFWGSVMGWHLMGRFAESEPLPLVATVALLALFAGGALALAMPFRQKCDARHGAAVRAHEAGYDSGIDSGAEPDADSDITIGPDLTSDNPGGNSAQDNDPSALERVAAMVDEELDRRVASLGLTPRERECATLVLRGLSQHEVAARCGIKDTTVRTTLHHVYKKAGVSNAHELAELIATCAAVDEKPCTAAEVAPVTAHIAQEPRIPHSAAQAPSTALALAESLQAVGLFTLAATVLLPVLSESEGWGYGFEMVIGVSAGVLLFVAAGICAQTLAPLSSKAPGFSHFEPWRRACQLAGITLICAAGLLCIRRVDPASELVATAFRPTPVIACSCALLAYAALQLLCRNARHRCFSCVLEVIGSLAIVAALARAGLGFSAAYAGLALYGLSSLALIKLSPRRQKPLAFQLEQETPPHLTLLKVVLGAFLGFAFEELWRDVGAESYVLALVPLCLPLVGVSIAVIARHRGRVWLWVAGSVAWLVILVALGEGYIGLLALGIALAAYSLALSSERLFHPALFASFGIFAAANIIAVSIVQDWAMWEPLWVLRWFSSGWTFSVASVVLVCSICALAGACHWLLCREYEYLRAAEHYRASEQGAKERPARLRALLETYGLSDVQSEIMLMTAAGSTAREISERLHYAVPTIKGYRTKCYKMLSVHGIEELRDLLSQLDSM